MKLEKILMPLFVAKRRILNKKEGYKQKIETAGTSFCLYLNH